MDTLGQANFDVIILILLYRKVVLKVKLYCHGSVGTTEFLYRNIIIIIIMSLLEVYIVSLLGSYLNKVPLYMTIAIIQYVMAINVHDFI